MCRPGWAGFGIGGMRYEPTIAAWYRPLASLAYRIAITPVSPTLPMYCVTMRSCEPGSMASSFGARQPLSPRVAPGSVADWSGQACSRSAGLSGQPDNGLAAAS